VSRPRLRFPLATALVLLLIAGLALAACGDSEESTVTETTTVTTDSSTTSEATSTGSTTTPDGETPPADIEVADSATFVSPTGNIGCFIDKTAVRCDIAERDWEPPKAPADCELDYGQGITLSAGGAAELVCAGDTVLGSGGDELAYGQSISAGLLRCESSEDGITCRDTETGRGFRIARETYDLF
jgi:hypothetical protein